MATLAISLPRLRSGARWLVVLVERVFSVKAHPNIQPRISACNLGELDSTTLSDTDIGFAAWFV